MRNSETLVFAVGESNGLEARSAARLAAVLKNNSSRLQLKIVSNGDNAKALAQFDATRPIRQFLRTNGKIPRGPHVAILDHDVMLLISPGGKKIKTIADLKKKKIAVLAESESSVTCVRAILSSPEPGSGDPRPDGAAGIDPDKLFASGHGAVVAIAHASRIMKDKSYEQFARAAALP